MGKIVKTAVVTFLAGTALAVGSREIRPNHLPKGSGSRH